MKLFAALAVVLFYVGESLSVPLKENQMTTNSAIKIEDPCDLVELEVIPKCDDKDEKCGVTNEKKRKKRQTLCQTYPNCSYCGTLIPDDLTENDEPNEVDDQTINIADIVEPNFYPANETNDPPRKLIERNIIIENDNETQYYRGFVESAANITTIIRLTNLINNTNIVNMPTTLNNTNINNIHVYQNKTSNQGGKFGLGYDENGSCCYSSEPKSCKQSTTGPKCRYKKHKVCGRQCTRKVIHPKRNGCNNIPQWPYVACPPNQQPQFNPGFYPPPQYPGFYPPSPPQGGFDNDDYDYDSPTFPDDEELENPESGWVVGAEKCKVVSEDGLQISNCTGKGVEFEHPFARNTVSEPIKRHTRNAKHPGAPIYQNQMMQPMMMPVMYQPVYLQPVFMPQYAPQYYQQQPQGYNYYQPQQIPQPPFHDSLDDTDQESEEVITTKKLRKQAKPRHPVLTDDDDEL